VPRQFLIFHPLDFSRKEVRLGIGWRRKNYSLV
jgi:hypothetical protein